MELSVDQVMSNQDKIWKAEQASQGLVLLLVYLQSIHLSHFYFLSNFYPFFSSIQHNSLSHKKNP